MLHINDLTYRIGERLLIDHATVALPTGAQVGLVGRNGAGKTTLFRLITGEIARRKRARSRSRKSARIGRSRRKRRAARRALIDVVLAADTRARRAASPRPRPRPIRTASPRSRRASPTSTRIRRPARAAAILRGLGFDEAGAARPAVGVLRRLAHARGARGGAVRRARPAAARRADQLSRSRRHAVARELSAPYPGTRPHHQPRPRPAQRRRRLTSSISSAAS